jgi:hypothetical protein
LLLAFIGVGGMEYGTVWFYSIPVGICLLQFIFPTPVGWGTIFGLFAAATAAMFFGVVRDVVRLAVGQSPSMLVDLDDSFAFVLFTAVLCGITTWLFFARPRRVAV